MTDPQAFFLKFYHFKYYSLCLVIGQDIALSSPMDGVLVFNATSVSGQQACATINPLDDDMLEGSESLQVTLSSPTGGANLDDPMTATINIEDNDGTYSLSHAPPLIAPVMLC